MRVSFHRNRVRATLWLFLFSIQSCLGQTDADNHRKYWYYRSRLVNDFVKVGLGDGESMPFNQRGKWSGNGFNDLNHTTLAVGDSSSTLGYYIGLLAMEYHLLARNHQETKKVVHELFCALNAVNRIDYKAEGLYTSGAERLNGFFVRDDIPASLLTNNLGHFNYYENPSRGFMSKMQHAADLSESEWIGATTQGHDIAMSQDQVYDLLFGLAFVNKFVSPSETDNNLPFPYSSQTSLTQESKNIAARLISFMQVPTDVAGSACGNPGNTFPNIWRIRNPTTCNLVQTGDDASPFAYPLSEIKCQLYFGMDAPITYVGFVPHSCPWAPYDPYIDTLGYAAWNASIRSVLSLSPDYAMDTRVFYSNLAAIGNCSYGTVGDQIVLEVVTFLEQIPELNWFGAFLGWIYNIVSQVFAIFIPGYKMNTTYTDIVVNAYLDGAPIDHAPLARAVLHGGLYQPNTKYGFKYLLDVAPCDDIYNFGTYQQSTYHWSSDSRLDHPNRMGKDPGIAQFPSGEYNAIDYMLYHNLWYIYQTQLGSNQQITDLSDIHIEQPSYSSGNIDAFETVTIENTSLNLSSPTYIRAGKTIYFGPGSQITPGSNLHAYIEGYHCATDTGQF